MAKKVTRKQLLKEPDEFMTFSGKLMKFMTENRLSLIIGMSALFALIVIASGIRFFSNKAENDAFAMLRENMGKYDELMKGNDPKKAYQGVKESFEKLSQEYSGKTGGNVGRVVFANICYEAGEPSQAIGLYEKALEDLGKDPSLKPSILNGLAYSHEAKKDYDNALKYFEMIVSEPEAAMKGEALFNVARLYAKKGDVAKSGEAYKKIVSDYGDSVYAQIAKERTAG